MKYWKKFLNEGDDDWNGKFILPNGEMFDVPRDVGHWAWAVKYIEGQQEQGKMLDFKKEKAITYLIKEHNFVRAQNNFSYEGPNPQEVPDATWKNLCRPIFSLVDEVADNSGDNHFRYESIDRSMLFWERSDKRFKIALKNKAPLPEDNSLIRNFHEAIEKIKEEKDMVSIPAGFEVFFEDIATYLQIDVNDFKKIVISKISSGGKHDLHKYFEKMMRHGLDPSKIKTLSDQVYSFISSGRA